MNCSQFINHVGEQITKLKVLKEMIHKHMNFIGEQLSCRSMHLPYEKQAEFLCKFYNIHINLFQLNWSPDLRMCQQEYHKIWTNLFNSKLIINKNINRLTRNLSKAIDYKQKMYILGRCATEKKWSEKANKQNIGDNGISFSMQMFYHYEKPKNMDKMIEIAMKKNKQFDSLRDFYDF